MRVFLGPSGNHKGFRCLSSSGKVYIPRHVIFPYPTLFDSSTALSPPSTGSLGNLDVLTHAAGTPSRPSVLPCSVPPTSSSVFSSVPVSPASPLISPSCGPPSSWPGSFRDQSVMAQVVPLLGPTNVHPMQTRSKHGIVKTKHPFVGFASSTVPEPRTIREALAIPEWRNAMLAEYNALVRNIAWCLVPSSPQYHVVGNKWVFKKKYKADGSLDKFKARSVAKGHLQEPGVDSGDVLSPVVKMTSVRLVLTLASTGKFARSTPTMPYFLGLGN